MDGAFPPLEFQRLYDSDFFKKRGGYPKFKSKRSAQKYRTPNNKGSIRLDGDAAINILKKGLEILASAV